jgi:hypothetical protein
MSHSQWRRMPENLGVANATKNKIYDIDVVNTLFNSHLDYNPFTTNCHIANKIWKKVMTNWLSRTFSYESPSNIISNIRSKRIDWNTKSRIRNNVIQIELIYTFDFTIGVFTIILLNFNLYSGVIANSTSTSAWSTST